MNKRQDSIVFYCGLIASGLLVYFWVIPHYIRQKANVPIGPELFPKLVIALIVVLSLVGVLLEYRAMRAAGESFGSYGVDLKKYLPHAVFLLSGAVFVAAAPTLGFVVAAVLFLLFLLFYFGSQNRTLNIVIAVCYPIVLFLLFSRVLGISFPPGIFGI